MASGVSFGIISSFDHLSQEWCSYLSRLKNCFIANDIDDEHDKAKVKRRAILLSAFSEATYKLASNLALPKKLEELEYDVIIDLLDKHFTPKKCGFAERFHFYSATQQAGESHAQWAARIRGLASHCGFKNLEEAVLDKFVMGMAAGHEKDKLFAQDLQGLTLCKAVEMAASVRCAREAAAAASRPPAASGMAGGDGAPVFSISSGEKCSVCGYTSHKADKCRFKNYKCKKCGQKGHLRRVCGQKNKVHYVEEDKVDEGDDGESFYNIRCVKGKPMTERVMVNGLCLEFEIDSGSAVSVISENTYNSYFKEVPLSPTSKKLLSYTGSAIITIGCARVSVSYGGSARLLELYVVRGGGPPLLGRDFIRAFQLELAPASNYYCADSDDKFTDDLEKTFPNLFSDKLGCFNKYQVNLKLKPQSNPVFFKPRPVPFALREKIDNEIDRLVKLGVLKPVEHSDYASPIVPVLKKDGTVRLCADYSVTINKQLVIDTYPLPTVQELFSRLHGGEQFTKLDLSMAYLQFPLNESSQSLTCINTHRGLFQYTRMVFGLSSAPAIFQRAMECVLAGLEGTMVFLDDILVTGSNKIQHKERLLAVLKRLEEAGFILQKNKCDFFKEEIHYLGHIINKEGIRKSPEKIKAVIEAPNPKNLAQLQSFLGMVNYYRSFVPEASSILSPLYALLNKNSKWEWGSEQQSAFETIKCKLASDQVLTHFNPNAKIILTVDASPTGLGAVLSQCDDNNIERPISFASRTLTAAERNYSQIQKEATAIIFGIRRFHQYLYGRTVPFVLRTDHKPLITIFGPYRGIPEISANRLQRYAMFLSAYNYIIEYVKSADNTADYLSRASIGAGASAEESRAEDAACEERAAYVNFVLEGSLPVTLQQMRHETASDRLLQRVIHYVQNGWPRKVSDADIKPYFLCRLELAYENGCLMRGHKVIIPSTLRKQICDELHASHFGINKMKAEARRRFWFPGVDATLERLAASCFVCAQTRPTPPHAPLAPWPYPPHAFYRIHVDFLGPFNDHMYLVIVDAYSKWVECYNMNTSYGSRAVINKLYEYMSRFGIPHTLVSDNGTSFTSREFADFCSLNGIRHVLTPAYHPASNGQAESFVKIIKRGLKNVIAGCKNNKLTPEKIAKFLFDYRNSKHSTTERSPSELLFGRPLRARLDLINPFAAQVTPASTVLAQSVEQKQCSQAKNYKGIARRELQINDKVWVKKHLANNKFCWIEGVITGKMGHVMYRVYVPDWSCEVTRHIDQIWTVKGNMQSETQHNQSRQDSWDSDIVPDHHAGSSLASTSSSTPATAPLSPSDCHPQEGDRVEPSVDREEEEDEECARQPAQGLQQQEARDEQEADGSSGYATPTSGPTTEQTTPVQQNIRSRRNREVISYKPFF